MTNIDWFAVGAGRWEGQPERPPAPSAEPAPVDQLQTEWLRVKREVETAMKLGMIPGSGWVYDPRLDVLKAYVEKLWPELPQPAVLDKLLGLIASFQENVSAAVFAYAFLRTALIVCQAVEQAEVVARYEMAYMNAVGIESHPTDNPDVTQATAAPVAQSADPDEDDL
jgi:hypothetical protein